MNQAEFDSLRAAAQSGQTLAQETLADLFATAGRGQEAREWLTRAAASGQLAAVTRLGLWEIVGFGGAQDVETGLSRILASADAGHADAAHTASLLYGGGVGAPRDSNEGLRRLAQAARLGHARAAAQLGVLIGADRPDGAALLRRAARAGSGVAMYALGRGLPDAAEAHAWLAAAAAAGHPLAPKSDSGPFDLPDVHEDPDWNGLVDAADLAWVEWPFERDIECEEPRIEVMAGFLPLQVCDYVIGMAAPKMSRGKVVDEHGGESVRQERSNAVMTFGLADSDFLLELVSLRTARAVGMPPENAEGLGVLHYLPGESYAPHSDFIPDTPANAAQLALRGQRARTLLVYLNEQFTGGETVFPLLDLRFKPPAGAALAFHNVDARGGASPRSLHAGTPPTSGEKWLISKWFRTKALRPGPASLMILAGILTMVIPRFTVAQDLPASLKECRSEKDDALRLACYDRKVGAQSQSPAAGTAAPASVPVSSPTTPEEQFGYENVRDLERRDPNRSAGAELDELVARVADVSRPAGGVYVITLENGQVWKQNSPDPYFQVRAGEQVRIKRAALGSFMLSGKSWWSIRVSRVR